MKDSVEGECVVANQQRKKKIKVRIEVKGKVDDGERNVGEGLSVEQTNTASSLLTVEGAVARPTDPKKIAGSSRRCSGSGSSEQQVQVGTRAVFGGCRGNFGRATFL